MLKTLYISGIAFALLMLGACSNDDSPISDEEVSGNESVSNITSEGFLLWDGSVQLPSVNDVTKSAVINSPSELAGLASLVNSGSDFKGYTFTLGADLDLSDNIWTPIGKGRRTGITYNGTPFAGVFDGNGKTIRGLKVMNVSGKEGAGLFAAVSGTVKNLNFIKVDINETTGGQTGTVAGMVLDGGVVENIKIISGNVKGTTGVGGVVGRLLANGSVLNCTNEASVKGHAAETGGIVGAAYYTSKDKKMCIENCVNRGSVSSNSEAVGGIAGYSAAFIKDCSNYGQIRGVGNSIGGLVGSQRCAGGIIDSHNFGNVMCSADEKGEAKAVGGIVGRVLYPGSEVAYPQRNVIEIDGCTNSGNVTASIDESFGIGGIAGVWDMMGKVNNCTNTALLISGGKNVAGIIGCAEWPVSGELVPDGAEEMLYINNNASATTLEQMGGNNKVMLLNTTDSDRTSLSNNSSDN